MSVSVDIVVTTLRQILAKRSFVLAAQAYGSWRYSEVMTDIDVAVVIPSSYGIVDRDIYRQLRGLRSDLAMQLPGMDFDLVPHTYDEFDDKNSPLWFPRYNPSLVFGETVKGLFPIKPSSTESAQFGFSELAAYVLHDNRTVCRRQAVRTFEGEAGRIFVSKLLHGPGNALTYLACQRGNAYAISPSDLTNAVCLFDEVYDVNSSVATEFFLSCKRGIGDEQALMLLYWYETLVALVLKGAKFAPWYQEACQFLAREHVAANPGS